MVQRQVTAIAGDTIRSRASGYLIGKAALWIAIRSRMMHVGPCVISPAFTA
jgi:hypothetical protein